MLRAEVFGGLRFLLDGTEREVVGAQRRRLASVLLAHSPDAVSVSRLMEYLDPDAKSANPVNAIQAQIGRLRRSIEPGISGRDAVHLRSIGDGYALIPDTMDLWDFRELVAQGARLETTDPRRAVEVQSQALDMFAAPLGELADDPLIVGFVASVVGEEMALRDDWMESLLRAGLAVEHVDKMVSAVRSEPTRERRCVHAMHALCRAGRQADALRLHEEVRIVLRDELGVSPGDGLREMHSRVLAQDPTLHSRHTSVDGDMDRDTTSFVGRREELNTMSDLLDRHRVVTVCGLSGVGKSRLARQWLDQNYRLARAIWVRVPAAEAGADAPDVTEALSEALGLGELTEQADRVDRWGSARASLPHNSILVVIDGAENNLDDAARVVLELCDARPGVSVLVTSQVPLGISGEQVMLLNPLPMPEVDGSLEGTAVQLAQDRLGQGVGLRTAIELSERCGGLPLVVEMAAKIPEAVLGDPSYATSGDGSGRPDPGVVLSRVVDSATEHLSPKARELLRLTCALPAGLSMGAAEWVCASERPADVHDPFEHRRVMGELVRSSLLKSVTGSMGVRFVAPEQVSRLVVDATSPEDQGIVNRANAGYLLTALKGRYSQQALRVDPQCRDLLAEEVPNLAAAQRHLFECDRQALAELLIEAVIHGRLSNAKHRIKQWVEQLLESAPAHESPDARLVICSVLLEPDLAAVAKRRSDVEQARRTLSSIGLEGSGWAFAVEVLLAIACGWTGELAIAMGHITEAKRIVGGEPWANAAVDRYLSLLIFAEGRPAEALALAESSADRLEELGDPVEALGALFFGITMARTAGMGELRALLTRASNLVGASDTSYRPLIMAEQARLAEQDGDPNAVRILAEAASALEAAGLLRTGATTRRDLGLLHLANGAIVAAELELLRGAEALLILDPMGSAMAFGGLAVCIGDRDAASAANLARIAWSLSSTSGTPLSAVEHGQLTQLIGEPDDEAIRVEAVQIDATQVGAGNSAVIAAARELLDQYPT